jgi:hypothetical protein
MDSGLEDHERNGKVSFGQDAEAWKKGKVKAGFLGIMWNLYPI